MQKTRAFAADGWKLDLTDEEILEKLLSLGSLRFGSACFAQIWRDHQIRTENRPIKVRGLRI